MEMKIKMRRKDREKGKEFALAVIDKCEYATLATVNEDGSPYCIPISIGRIDDYIYFHSAMAGQKIENIKRNNKVCLSFVGDTYLPKDEFTTKYESAIVYGTAYEVIDDSEKITALKLLCEKYTMDNMMNFDSEVNRSINRTGVWKIRIDNIAGKSNF